MLHTKAIAEILYTAQRVLDTFDPDHNHTPRPEWSVLTPEKRDKWIGIVEQSVNAIPRRTPEDQHNAWMVFMIDDGWKRGGKLDSDNKEHPSLCLWSGLSSLVKERDFLTCGICDSLGRGGHGQKQGTDSPAA